MVIGNKYTVTGFRAYLKNDHGCYSKDFTTHEEMENYVKDAWSSGEEFYGYVEMIQQG